MRDWLCKVSPLANLSKFLEASVKRILGPNVAGIVSGRRSFKVPIFNNRAYSQQVRIRSGLLGRGNLFFRGSRILAKYHGLLTGKVVK